MVLVDRRRQREPRPRPNRNRPEPEEPLIIDVVPAMENLEPVGGGFYATSSEPASPFDCERWPDSPFCGGFPFTEQPIGFNPSLVFDECNVGVEFAPVFGFVKLPPIQFVYRFPGECRLPPPPPERPVEGLPPCPPPQKIGSASPMALAIGFVSSRTDYREVNNMNLPSVDEATWQGYWELSTLDTVIRNVEFGNGRYATVTFSITRRFQNSYGENNEGTSYAQYEILSNYPMIGFRRISSDWATGNVIFEGVIEAEPGWIDNILFPRIANNFNFTFCGEFRDPASSWYIYGFQLPDPENPPTITWDSPIRSFSVDPNPVGTFNGVKWVYEFESLIIENRQSTIQILQGDYTPPPPPDRKKCKCMCCDDGLLKLILKRVNDLHKTVGSGDYPVSVPQWLTREKSPQINIANLTRYMSYVVKQLDAVTGSYPIKITIKDSNLTQEGDQKKTMQVPNAAEGLAEILGLLLAIRSEVSAILPASINSMVEAGSAKQSAIVAADYARANAEFLGYKGRQVEKQVPYSFKPGEEKLDEMMKPTQVKVKSWDNVDKDDFNDVIAPLLELAAMWKAQNFRNLGAASPVEKLREILKGASDIPTAMAEFRKYPTQPSAEPGESDTEPEAQKDEWDVFLEQAEEGFIQIPGISDNEKPYGRRREQRPRIRELGDTSDTEGNNQQA